jgi:uncharacterized membrane protein (DUF373 family)
MKRLPRSWGHIRADWAILTAYQRFESIIALLLSLVIAVVVLVALYRLISGVIDTLVLRALNPLEHTVFQQVFGEIMTVLIALEFNHTLHYAFSGSRGVIQAKVVILIAQLAIVRKLIVADFYGVTPAWLAGLAALILALGITYWLMRERDDRLRRPVPASRAS